jgi:hypothetical protein
MTKTLTKLAVIGLMTVAAQATTITLGTVVKGTPANFPEELDFVNTLVDHANGINPSSVQDPSKTYTLINDPLAILPKAITAGADDVESWSGDVVFGIGSGFSYVLIKEGTKSTIFYSDDGAFNIVDGGKISHYTAFKANTTTVPDGGATVALLGMGLLGVGMMRRKLS